VWCLSPFNPLRVGTASLSSRWARRAYSPRSRRPRPDTPHGSCSSTSRTGESLGLGGVSTVSFTFRLVITKTSPQSGFGRKRPGSSRTRLPSYASQPSDALPRKVNLTLPTDWTKRRLRVPKGVVVHHGDVPTKDRVEAGSVPVTNARRTFSIASTCTCPPQLIEAAVRQAPARGLIDRDDMKAIRARDRAA
jgi:hypothetical protein